MCNHLRYGISLAFLLFGFINYSEPTSALPIVLSNRENAQIIPTGDGVLGDLWNDLFGEKEGESTTRTDYCSLWPNPSADMVEVWHTQPSFIWKVFRIGEHFQEVVEVSIYEENNDIPFEQYDASDFLNLRRYGDLTSSPAMIEIFEPPDLILEVGKSYLYKISFRDSPDDPNIVHETIEVRVMDSNQRREDISSQLETIQNRSPLTASESSIAIQGARVFSEYELWGDTLQEIFSVDSPSVVLEYNVINKIKDQPGCIIKPREANGMDNS